MVPADNLSRRRRRDATASGPGTAIAAFAGTVGELGAELPAALEASRQAEHARIDAENERRKLENAGAMYGTAAID
jgi:hypothetical protein